MPCASLQSLLAGTIDYAGLFPPAELALAPALKNHANYLRSAEAWMLGAFVLPVKKFAEAAPHFALFNAANPLRISALGPKTENAAQFLEALTLVAKTLREFSAAPNNAVRVTQIEMELPASAGATLAETNKALAGIEVPIFLESSWSEAERTTAFIAERRSTGAGRFCFKLRTGGVIASAFPSSVQIARALVAAAKHQVPIKFTAGLHHPVRAFHPSVQTKMHGFLNVLGAGVLAAEHKWDVQQTALMLEEEDAANFVFHENGFAWREWKIATRKIAEHRQLITSFGSCSFDEPREDLRALGLL